MKTRKYIGLVYILPWLLGFLIFKLYPFSMSIYYSFTDANLLRAPNWVGFANYVRLFTRDKYFFDSLLTTCKYVLISVPLKLAFALLVAMLLNSNTASVNFFRTLYYLPSILGGSVAVSMIWRFLFAKDGVMNGLLAVFGIAGRAWLGDPSTALFTVSLLNVWQFGSSMVLFFAGIRQVPAELYEAATVDGVSKVRAFFHITLPMISSIVLFNMVMQMVNTFQEFTSILLITNGGPLRATYVYGMMLYENAFTNYKMGLASAQSWILFIIIITLTGILLKTSNRWTYYEDGGKF